MRVQLPLLHLRDATSACRYQFSDGLQFKGLWKDGRRDGKGIL